MTKLDDKQAWQQLRFSTHGGAVPMGMVEVLDGLCDGSLVVCKASIHDDLETERIRLAACGVAAGQNTEWTKGGRITSASPYYSASYEAVCDTVDREMRYFQVLKDIYHSLGIEWGDDPYVVIRDLQEGRKGLVQLIADYVSDNGGGPCLAMEVVEKFSTKE